MKKHLSPAALLCFLLLCISGSAQLKESDYKKQANEIRNTVWGWKIDAFNQRTVPDKYAKQSKVILAKHFEVIGYSKSKFFLAPPGSAENLTYTRTIRELVKINDAAALEEYADISFQKFEQRKASSAPRGKDKFTTFLGVRIIKPDGTVKEISTDEAVLTNNSDKNKKAKLAISGLQIGDLLDYFIQTEEVYYIGDKIDAIDIVFAGDSPIMHYSVHVEVNKNFAIEYRPMNGAPDFRIERTKDKEIIMDADASNIEPFPINLWMSPYRQTPVTRLHLILGNKGSGKNNRKPGELTKDVPSTDIVDDYKESLETVMKTASMTLPYINPDVKSLLSAYFTRPGVKPGEDDAIGLFYALRHLCYFKVSKTDPILVNARRNYTDISDAVFLTYLQALFDKNNIASSFVLAPSKYGPPGNEIIIPGDLDIFLATDKHIFSANGIFGTADEIYYSNENQASTSLNYKLNILKGPKVTIGSTTTPKTPASANQQKEELTITFDPANLQKLNVQRQTTLTGYMKRGVQKSLLLFEDYYEEESKAMGVKVKFLDQMDDNKKKGKLTDEYKTAFAEARKEQKDAFAAEIEDEYKIKPTEVVNYQIVQNGMFQDKSDLIYSSNFVLNDLIKKAGNNYIIDAGKLIGSQLKIKDGQRDRKVDVYMPHARGFQYTINIPVPEGYTIEGFDKLNKNIKNATGCFKSQATIDNNVLTILAYKEYSHDFEKQEDWPKLLEVIDAATDFNSVKLMLKKKA
ncbi:DUF3857 domain-containing protein [Chitinophagaceae bacterium LWZ2-11]